MHGCVATSTDHFCHSLCDHHTPAHLENAERWTVIRDVLHALLVPIVELFDKACAIAEQATHAQRAEELEYAYTGNGRGAFTWLQCFLENERDWCYTKGCPACIAEHALDSEFTIRMLFAACLLSDVHYPFTLEGPTLPSFMFFLESLDLALINDSLWGAEFFEITQPKAVATRNGIEDLIHQCLELEAVSSAPPSPSLTSVDGATPLSPALGPLGGPGMRVKRSKMAKRQLKLMAEEGRWMEEMLRKCCENLLPPEEEMLLPPQSLDAVLTKGDTSVTITALAPED